MLVKFHGNQVGDFCIILQTNQPTIWYLISSNASSGLVIWDQKWNWHFMTRAHVFGHGRFWCLTVENHITNKRLPFSLKSATPYQSPVNFCIWIDQNTLSSTFQRHHTTITGTLQQIACANVRFWERPDTRSWPGWRAGILGLKGWSCAQESWA